MRGIHEALAASLWVYVCLVDIIRKNGRNGDKLGGKGRSDGHEDNQERGYSTTGAEEGNSGIGKGETGADGSLIHTVGVGRERGGVLESKSSKAHGGSAKPL